ncbi:MAG: 4'-phosphopantetheinyl transferase superfamily protein [Bacteroidetes bacterium]|nr:4'-phosphopantetheinyl transferase superfamily protein [Bacteroidota bacterium]
MSEPQSISWQPCTDFHQFSILNPNEIHLWSFDHEESIVKLCADVLNEDQIKSSSSYNNEQAKNNFIVSQGVQQLLLPAYLDIDKSELILSKEDKGKPMVKNHPSVFFNLSNSGGCTVIAITSNADIGVDLEEIRLSKDLDQMIEVNFITAEQKYINDEENLSTERFFMFWTIKEGYLKAIGEGMRLTPDKLEFSMEKDQFKLQNVDGVHDFEDWVFEVFKPSPNFIGAVVHQLIDPDIKGFNFRV